MHSTQLFLISIGSFNALLRHSNYDFIREADIKAWRDDNGLRFIQCACKFTDICTSCNPSNTGSKRQKVKELIRKLKEEDPEIEQNIFKSVENVSLSTVVAYKDKEGNRHFFADEY